MNWLELHSKLYPNTIALISAIATAFAALGTIGAVIVALFGPRMSEKTRRADDRHRIAAAFEADLQALLTLTVNANLKETLVAARESYLFRLKHSQVDMQYPRLENLFPVTMYDLAGEDIGLLGQNIAQRLIRFYNALAGFRVSHTLAFGESGLGLANRIASIDQALKVLDEQLLPAAPSLIADLQVLAGCSGAKASRA